MAMTKLTDRLKLEGASDTVLGTAPISVAAAATSTSAGIDMAFFETAVFCFLVGVSDTVFTHTLYEAISSDFSDEQAMTDPAAVTHSAADDGKARFIDLRASKLSAGGYRYVRAKSAAVGGAAGLLAVQIIGGDPHHADQGMTLGHV